MVEYVGFTFSDNACYNDEFANFVLKSIVCKWLTDVKVGVGY